MGYTVLAVEYISRIVSSTGVGEISGGNVLLIGVGIALIVVAIVKEYEPLLLVPLGFGMILANIPGSGLLDNAPGGIFYYFFEYTILTDLAPIMLFFGIGAMTDLGPLLARPSLFLISAFAQGGQFVVLLIAAAIGFSLKDSAAIAIIGGANGPVTVFMATKLSPPLLGPIVVTAYLYMALVHFIQPPVLKLLTTAEQRKIEMKEMREVSRAEKITFIVVVTILACLLLPVGTPLFAFFLAGNLVRESGVTDRLSKAASEEITNIFLICLVFGISYTLNAEQFLKTRSLLILGLGLVGFITATIFGTLTAQLLWWLSKGQVNPLLGAAGLSAVPHSARVVQVEGRKANPKNFLIMHAMGPNMGAIIASSVVACVIYALLVG